MKSMSKLKSMSKSKSMTRSSLYHRFGKRENDTRWEGRFEGCEEKKRREGGEGAGDGEEWCGRKQARGRAFLCYEYLMRTGHRVPGTCETLNVIVYLGLAANLARNCTGYPNLAWESLCRQ